MVMDLQPRLAFVPGARRVLFPLTRFSLDPSHQQYSVAPDDKRFLMIRATESDRADHLIVVENFFEVLRRRTGRR
jgi:hypothetical protein